MRDFLCSVHKQDHQEYLDNKQTNAANKQFMLNPKRDGTLQIVYRKLRVNLQLLSQFVRFSVQICL